MEIHVCPNGCASCFDTTAHVMECWKVNAMGEWVETLETLETTHGPDDGNIWTCLECGAEADIIKVDVKELKIGDSVAELYFPVTPNGYVYWRWAGINELRRVSADEPFATFEGNTINLGEA